MVPPVCASNIQTAREHNTTQHTHSRSTAPHASTHHALRAVQATPEVIVRGPQGLVLCQGHPIRGTVSASNVRHSIHVVPLELLVAELVQGHVVLGGVGDLVEPCSKEQAPKCNTFRT